jgi:hypothetical protein
MWKYLALAVVTIPCAAGCPFSPQQSPQPAKPPSVEEVKQKVKGAYEAVRDYAFAEKDKYVAEMKDHLGDFDKQIAELKTEARQATGQAKEELERRLGTLEEHRATVAKKLEGANSAGSESWDNAKKEMDEALKHLKTEAGGLVQDIVKGKPDEVLVKQRHSAALPGLDGKVQVQVGDVKSEQDADVAIVGPGSRVLASKVAARVGDRIPFEYEGKTYDLEVVRYIDEIVGNDDYARFRLVPKP